MDDQNVSCSERKIICHLSFEYIVKNMNIIDISCSDIECNNIRLSYKKMLSIYLICSGLSFEQIICSNIPRELVSVCRTGYDEYYLRFDNPIIYRITEFLNMVATTFHENILCIRIHEKCKMLIINIANKNIKSIVKLIIYKFILIKEILPIDIISCIINLYISIP